MAAAFSLLLLFGAAAGVAAEKPLRIDDRRQLLFDDRFVQQSTGVEFKVHQPRKTGEPIVSSEPGQALGGYISALFDSGTYHLWYMAASAVHYLRSSDGVNWDRPNLAFRQKVGSERAPVHDNLVLGKGVGGVKGGVHGLMVFIDPTAPADEKFRLVCNPEEFDRKVQIFVSPDGVHWKHAFRDVIGWKGDKPQLDSPNVIFWDERLNRYVAYYRLKLRTNASPTRVVARSESPDLAHFPPAEDGDIVMRADLEHPGHLTPKKVRVSVLDTYTNGALKYPWAEDAYFMFPTEYYHFGTYQYEFREGSPVNAGVLDTRFAASRDGIRWQRYDHQAFIPLGMKDEFDSKRVYCGYGIVPAPNGRELYMYYVGTSETHGWNRDDKNNALLTAAGQTPTGPTAISRVVLRRDGFVSVRSAYNGGEFTTPLLRFTGQQLLLNVDTSASGELRVEILDPQNQPIPGYSLEDCDLVHAANEINHVVSWKGSTSVDGIANRPVRLHFVMRDVDLYAFQFAARGGI